MREVELEQRTAPVQASVVWSIWLSATVILGCLTILWWAFA